LDVFCLERDREREMTGFTAAGLVRMVDYTCIGSQVFGDTMPSAGKGFQFPIPIAIAVIRCQSFGLKNAAKQTEIDMLSWTI